jgi:hypothetical protein
MTGKGQIRPSRGAAEDGRSVSDSARFKQLLDISPIEAGIPQQANGRRI